MAPRSTVPSVTRQPAILPTLETLKISRIVRVAEHGLAQRRREQAGHRLFHVVDEIVDDVVVADFDAGALRRLARFLMRAHVEADDRHAGGFRQRDVGFGDAAGAGMQHARGDFVGAELVERPMIASTEPCTSPLMISGNSLRPLVLSWLIICSSEPRMPVARAETFSRFWRAR